MATVIGLVGGGGIGYTLYQYINTLQWRQAGTAIWLISIAVILMDWASAVVREKYT
jgi:phosphonate transport system permease protein